MDHQPPPLPCNSCGYDLVGLSTNAPCPACGGVRGTARTARVCALCGYDLAGLAQGGKCPECGATELVTPGRCLLFAASPEYLRSLHNGLTLLILSMILFAAMRGPALVMSLSNMSVKSTPNQVMAAVATMLLAAPAMLNVVGHMRYTSADPLLIREESRFGARRVIRATTWALAPASLAILSFAVLGMTITSPPKSPIATGLLYAAEAINVLAWLIQMSAVLRFSNAVARRAGDDKLAERARKAAHLYPLCMVTPVLVAAGGLFIPQALCCVIPVGLVLWLSVGLAYMSVLSDLCERVGGVRRAKHAALVEAGLAQHKDRPPFN